MSALRPVVARLVTAVVYGPIGYVRHAVSEDLTVVLYGDPYRLSTVDVRASDGEVWLFFIRQTRGRYRRDFLAGTGIHERLGSLRQLAGLAELADRIAATVQPPPASTTEQHPMTPRPGGLSLESLRRVGSPNTHDRSGEDPMVLTKNPTPRTVNPDCVALGCDWDWGVEFCPGCGGSHTYRVCLRCLASDDGEFELCQAQSAVAA